MVRVARWVVPHLCIEQIGEVYWRWLAPLTAAIVATTLAWSWCHVGDLLKSLQQGASLVVFALALFVGLYLAVRIASNLRHRSRQLNVNPWL